jgi:hypothetical protein
MHQARPTPAPGHWQASSEHHQPEWPRRAPTRQVGRRWQSAVRACCGPIENGDLESGVEQAARHAAQPDDCDGFRGDLVSLLFFCPLFAVYLPIYSGFGDT